MTVAPAPAPRLEALDAMRGYAILGVVLAHTAQWTRPPAGWPEQLCANGALGVQLFFVASAFALFLANDRHQARERRPVADFFIRRFFRIAPMFYVGLIFFVWLVGLRERFWAPRGVTPLDVGLTALFLNGWHPETINAVVPGGWSVATEVSFYLILPVLFRLITHRTAALGLVAACLVLGYAMNLWVAPLLSPFQYPEGFRYLPENFRFFWIFGELPVFAFGILLFFLLRGPSKWTTARTGWAALAGAIVLGAALFRQMRPPLPPSFGATAVYGLAFLLFGAALLLTPSRALVNRPVVFLGQISYSLYFAHFAVLQFCFRYLPTGLDLPGATATPVALLLMLGVAGGISWLTYRVVELPGIALGRRLVARLEARVAAKNANGAENSAPS